MCFLRLQLVDSHLVPIVNIVNIIQSSYAVWPLHNFVSHHTYQITSPAMACHGTAWHHTTVQHVVSLIAADSRVVAEVLCSSSPRLGKL